MKVFCVHGIGHQESLGGWQDSWKKALGDGLGGGEAAHTFSFLPYDEALFAPRLEKFSRVEYATALAQLAYGRFRLGRSRGLFSPGDDEKWYGGMVVVWVRDAKLREGLRKLFEDRVKDADLIVAHSLGSLIAYDAIGQNPALLKGRTLLTFGSQIGNKFVQGGVFGGYVQPFAEGRWFHLYNSFDQVFTAPLDTAPFRAAENFVQVEARFGTEPTIWNGYFGSIDNHTPVNPAKPGEGYLDHPVTKATVYPRIAAAAGAAPARAVRALAAALPEAPPAPPNRRALIIGINQYADPANRLEGCVNDAFRMSEVLQESGFKPQDIRLVLDDRATGDGIRERLQWLLGDVRDGDTRVLAYSGHGAQLPLYGPAGRVDRVAACLVPYDFAWTEQTAITDDDLAGLYSTLPYGAQFLMLLDCCYSGGLARGVRRARGLEPPDDIRHRSLRWNPDEQMWEPRGPEELKPLNTALSARVAGANKATLNLGAAVELRPLKKAEYVKAQQAFGHRGPYMPVVYQACGPDQLAEEYEHGATSFGAFTFALTTQLRKVKRVTFQDLCDRTADRLKAIGYPQTPHVLGAEEVLKTIVPWGLADKK